VLRSVWLLFLYLSFLGIGVAAPFVMTLGYVWVDTFRPQEVTYIILNELPVALIMGAGSFLTYLALDRRSPPPLMLQSVLQIAMAIWMTASLLWAEVPSRAWDKWDWAFKAMVFAAFVPLVIRSRVQIEAFVQTFVFSLAANFVPFGIKVLISGGGYGQNLGLLSGNGGLAEGGYLSTVCLMAVPLALYLGAHGQLIPRIPMIRVAYIVVATLAVVTALGTYERSAVIGLVVLGIYMFLRSRRKLVFGLFAGMATVAIVAGSAASWNQRISTIGEYQSDNSAYVRVLVWQWTLGYVATHPLGGGFDAYVINTINVPPDEANPGGSVQISRAYHSIYFEVLGELGWPGLAMFLVVAVSSIVSLIRLSSKCRKLPGLAWVADMSDAVQSGMFVFLSSGAFVGLAFQPPFWYFVSMGICLRAYVWHAERTEDRPLPGWRRTAPQMRSAVGGVPELPAALPGAGPLRTPGWRGAPRTGRDAQ
jgi:probable O-glycosylation ligase (exosortase A-associated)